MGARYFTPVHTGPGAYPASCIMGTESFPGVKSGRGMKLTPHPFLVPWSRKSRARPYSPYRPYGLYRASEPEQGCTLHYLFLYRTEQLRNFNSDKKFNAFTSKTKNEMHDFSLQKRKRPKLMCEDTFSGSSIGISATTAALLRCRFSV